MRENIERWEITPERLLLDLKLKAVWQYRDLLLLMVRKDFVAFYKQTLLGPFWFLIQPLLTTCIFTLIFGKLGNISTDGLPKPLFYLAGITLWNYFSECLNKTASIFKDNSNLFGKVYFPRLIIPLSIILSNLIRFGVQLLLFFMVMTYYHFKGDHFEMTYAAFLLPFLLLLMALMGLGTGLIISALTTKYRDLMFLIAFGVQLLMYSTPIIYPYAAAPQSLKWLIQINPMTPIVESFRYGFLGQGTFSGLSLSYSLAITLSLLFSGIILFNKIEKDFIDII